MSHYASTATDEDAAFARGHTAGIAEERGRIRAALEARRAIDLDLTEASVSERDLWVLRGVVDGLDEALRVILDAGGER
jgi:hypothetical protein